MNGGAAYVYEDTEEGQDQQFVVDTSILHQNGEIQMQFLKNWICDTDTHRWAPEICIWKDNI